MRCIIRHSDLVSKDASFEYLESEGERTVMEALDALEFAMSHPLSKKTDCNHIFLNFASTLTVKDPATVCFIDFYWLNAFQISKYNSGVKRCCVIQKLIS